MTNTFSANEPALGYLYQIRFALYLLLQEVQERPESELSIERLDDVSFESEGTPEELIQLKHVTLEQASLTNSSKDLWKTLRIWSTKLKDQTRLFPQIVLSLVTTGSAGQGSAAEKLRQGSETR